MESAGRSPVTGPLPWPVFENLDDGGSNIVFSIEPRQRDIWVERSFPDEASVALKLHAEQWVGETGKVVVVDASVNKGSRQAYLADIVFDGELGTPHG